MTVEAIDYQKLAMTVLQQAVSLKDVASFKAVGSTPTGVNAHGPGGLFSSFGLSKPLFSAMVLPRVGLASRLPSRWTNEMNPLYGIITGVTASSGSNPTGVCDDPPTAGTMKLCTHSFVFGRFSRQTKVFDIESAGQTINRGEFTDLQVFGSPQQGQAGIDNPLVPSMPGMVNMTDAAAKTAAKALFELAVSWSRDFAKLTYTATPTNNTAGGGYKEFYGLDTLINTGYRDAETGIACAAADSIIYSFGNQDVRTNSSAIVRLITYTFRNLKFLASNAGLDPVSWVLAMPFSMFYELTEIWPIAYSTYRAGGLLPAGTQLFVGSDSELKMRDDMRGDLETYQGQYLLIDGQRVPVVIDTAITETQSGASFRASMYFVPVTVLGNRPVTYWEYFNYDAPGAALEMASVFAPGDLFSTSDSGRFLWHKKPPTNTCVQLLSYIRPRILMETPYLAARITGIQYTPLEHERSWDPASGYWKDGGRTAGDTTAPSYYSPTS